MKKKGLLVLLSIFFIASCSSVPIPINHPITTQAKVEAAQHWDVMAKDFAKQITMVMKEKPWPLEIGGSNAFDNSSGTGVGHTLEDDSEDDVTSSFPVSSPYIYIQTNDVSDFGKAFKTYLITELSKQGYFITNSPEGALKVNWSVNKIRHKANRQASFLGKYTATALIGSGIYKLFDSSSAYWGVLATGAALDLLDSAAYRTPSTEIILGFTTSKDTVILSRQTQAYYVNAEDFDHYNNIADYAGQESYLKPVKFKVTNY